MYWCNGLHCEEGRGRFAGAGDERKEDFRFEVHVSLSDCVRTGSGVGSWKAIHDIVAEQSNVVV